MKSLLSLQRDYKIAEVEHNRINKELTRLLMQTPWDKDKITSLRSKRALAKMNADELYREIQTHQLIIKF